MRQFFSKEPPLHEAIIQNNCQKAKTLIEQGYPLEQINPLGFTALEIAQFLGRDQILKLLSPLQFEHQLKITFPDLTEAINCSIPDLKAIFGVKYRRQLFFKDYSFFKETIKQCPFLLRFKWFTQDSQQLMQKHSEQLRQGYVADVEIKWTGQEKGFGLFAQTDLTSKTYIGEYTGLVRQLFRFNPDHNGYCYHYPTRWWSLKYLMVDACKVGNELRFANHSYDPNMEPFCMIDRNLLHIVLFTIKEVKKGEELTFNYGPDYWSSRS